MYRIKEWAPYYIPSLIMLFIFWPVIHRAESTKRQMVQGGVRILSCAFVNVQSKNSGAILWAYPYSKRHYIVSVDGNFNEIDLHLNPFKDPVPISVKVGSKFVFSFRHSSYQYRVSGINRKGIEIDVGGGGRALFYRNQKVFLPWNRPLGKKVNSL